MAKERIQLDSMVVDPNCIKSIGGQNINGGFGTTLVIYLATKVYTTTKEEAIFTCSLNSAQNFYKKLGFKLNHETGANSPGIEMILSRDDMKKLCGKI